MAGAAGAGTREYQRAQVALRSIVYNDVATLWRLLRYEDLDASFPLFAAGAIRLIEGRRVKSADLARAYLRVRRRGIAGTAPNVATPTLNRTAVLVSLRVTTVAGLKAAAAAGTNRDVALRNALVRTMGAIDKYVGDAGRELIRASIAADPAAKGWTRVTLGTCDFCEMLAGKMNGAGETFPRHDHCGCQPQPIYQGASTGQSTSLLSLLAYTPGADALGFTAAEQQALTAYQLNAFHDVNEVLRGQAAMTAETQELIDQLDGVLARSALESDMTLYRGIQDRFAGLEVGAEFNDAAFLSTSMDEATVSSIFADAEVMRESGEFVESVVIRLEVPKGTNALRLDSADEFYAREKEVLLRRGARFRITREQKGVPGESPTILWAEMLP